MGLGRARSPDRLTRLAESRNFVRTETPVLASAPSVFLSSTGPPAWSCTSSALKQEHLADEAVGVPSIPMD
jgi:hypothetical protein